jgi:hypothetical protein
MPKYPPGNFFSQTIVWRREVQRWMVLEGPAAEFSPLEAAAAAAAAVVAGVVEEEGGEGEGALMEAVGGAATVQHANEHSNSKSN